MYVKYLFLTYTSVFFVVNISMHIDIYLFIYIIIRRPFYLLVSNHIFFVLGKYTVSSLSNSVQLLAVLEHMWSIEYQCLDIRNG